MRRFAIGIATIVALTGQAEAQALGGKTIIYTAVSGQVSGYIFIAKSGTIYWSAAVGGTAKDNGVRFRLGGRMSETNKGCTSDTSASLAGAVLTLVSNSSCPALQFTSSDRMVVSISGNECSATQSVQTAGQSGSHAQTIRSESCRIVAGNQIAQ